MSLRQEIDQSKLPAHVAIIMDGNGRWALDHGKSRILGHHQGVESVRKVIEAAAEINLKFLTLYAFSTENWERPDDEVTALMGIMMQSLNDETETLLKNNIKLTAIGDLDRLDAEVKKQVVRNNRDDFCFYRSQTCCSLKLQLQVGNIKGCQKNSI